MSGAVANDLKTIYPKAKYIQINHPIYNQFGAKIERDKACSLLKIDPNKKTILFFGFIRTYKGLDVLIEAFNDLGDGYQLVIAGEVYGNFKVYDNLIQQAKNKENIYLFTDYIEDSKVSNFFSVADVCVLPYKSATQSGITAISYHFELPVIATDVGGLKENTEHLKTGLIVESPKSELIADAIRSYFDQGLYASMSQTIADQKNENSWESFAEKIIAFSKEL